MTDQHRMFPFSELHQRFADLLTRTAGNPHGRLPLSQEDDAGSVWEIVMPMSRDIAWRLLWEAMGGDMNVLRTPTGEVAGMSYMDSRLPNVDEFIIFSGDETHIFALYASPNPKGQFYVIRTLGRRFYELQLRGRYQSDTSRSLYDTMRQLYGSKPTLPALTAMSDDGGALVPE